jgi:hypothetical protein
MTKIYTTVLLMMTAFLFACKKNEKNANPDPPTLPGTFAYADLKVDSLYKGFNYYGVKPNPEIIISFSAAIDPNSVTSNVKLSGSSGNQVPYTYSLLNDDQSLRIQPASPLNFLSRYTLNVQKGLLSKSGKNLQAPLSVSLSTQIDEKDKFPQISDDELLTLVQTQTFKYFWDFGHPVSGLARERNTSGDIVTTGGSGFGLMALIVGIERNFISKAEGLARMNKVVDFLKDKADRFHGAYPHWLNGTTGKVVAFSAKDDGADIVETAFLIQGLLTVRQYFNGNAPEENRLRNNINSIWGDVEWSWFQKNKEDVLYWHWSPNHGWDMNMKVQGWNEALITYILAASSSNYSIQKSVYDQGWARNGGMKNGNTYFGIRLPLGPTSSGPLFFAHYSFLGINPTGLTDAYGNYEIQNKAHALIHYNYSIANPKGFYGYSEAAWGLTASDDVNGYLAHEPENDNGVISPTAALASFPYTPEESMQALKFYYYKLGDRLWGDYGFIDAFSLQDLWFSDSFLAIDQAPVIVMIENHRTGLLWDLFMSCQEVKDGMQKLGFQSPHF